MLDIQGRKYAAVTVCDVTLYDLVTKYPVMYFDTLQVTSIDGTTEVTEIQGGKGNPILASVSHSKNIDVQFDDAIMTMSSLAILTGGELSNASDTAKITMTQTEIIDITAENNGSITLSEAVKANSYVYIGKIINGIVSTVTRTTDKVEGGSNTILIEDFYNFKKEDEDITGKYRVFYEYELGVADAEGRDLSELTVLADKFAGTYRFIGDTMLFNQFTGLNDLFQIEIPRLKLDGSFSFSLNAAVEAVVFSFKGKALRDDFGKMIIFRNLTQEGKTGDETYGQYDGSYAKLPAKEVTVDVEDGTLKDVE
jgi:hypothetical protein